MNPIRKLDFSKRWHLLFNPLVPVCSIKFVIYDTVMRLTDVISPAGDFNYNYYYEEGSDDSQYITFGGGTFCLYRHYDGLERLYQSTLVTPLSSFDSPTCQFQYSYDTGSERTQQVFTAGNVMNYTYYTYYTYDNIGQLKTAQGFESDNVTPRLHEQFGYAYDAAWNLNRRTNNALVQSFGVNKLNELTNATRSGSFTVAGTATEPRGSVSGYPAGVTNVTVSGTGLSSGAAIIYADGSWARTNATLANGTNSYSATGQDTYGRLSTNTSVSYLLTTPLYSYDLNGNLLSDGTRYFAYDGTLDPGAKRIWGVYLRTPDNRFHATDFTGARPPYGLIFTLGDPDSGYAIILKKKP